MREEVLIEFNNKGKQLFYYHFEGGTLSMISIRSSVSLVLLFTEFILGHIHLQRLSSYDCA